MSLLIVSIKLKNISTTLKYLHVLIGSITKKDALHSARHPFY